MDSESTSQPPDGRDPDPSAQLSAEDRRAREAFIATKRHDLRTPINAIIGYGEMLLEDAEDAGATSLAADLGKISKAGHVLLRTVNDLLDSAKIDTGQVNLADIEGLGARIRHEMRDHINTVRGYSELLLEDAEGDDERQEFVSDLRKIHAAAGNRATHGPRVAEAVSRRVALPPRLQPGFGFALFAFSAGPVRATARACPGSLQQRGAPRGQVASRENLSRAGGIRLQHSFFGNAELRAVCNEQPRDLPQAARRAESGEEGIGADFRPGASEKETPGLDPDPAGHGRFHALIHRLFHRFSDSAGFRAGHSFSPRDTSW